MKLQWLIDGPSNLADWSTDVYRWGNNIQKSSQSTHESATSSIRKEPPEKTKKGGRVSLGAQIQFDIMNPSYTTATEDLRGNVGVCGKSKNAIPKDDPGKKEDVVIPLDKHCRLTTYKVYIDPITGLIYDASLNKTVSSANTNKFYNIQVLKDPISSDFKTWTRWGRVGEEGQKATLGNGTADDAIKQFQKKFKDMSGLAWNDRMDSPKPNKYVFIECRYSPHSDYEGETSGNEPDKKVAGEQEDKGSPPECTLEKPIKELTEFIFGQRCFSNTISALKYDAKKLPVGALSERTITSGVKQLKDLAALLGDPSLASSRWNMGFHEAIEQLSNTYYSFIPHAFGRKPPPIIDDESLVKREIELLQSLPNMKAAAELMKNDCNTRNIIHTLNRQFQGLGLEEMPRLDRHRSS
ncbi:poly(ADP)-ribose polymerase [Fusarium proliferatum]|nr:poly(ADP)-ribose polymerase [Fusarium proliferatum]